MDLFYKSRNKKIIKLNCTTKGGTSQEVGKVCFCGATFRLHHKNPCSARPEIYSGVVNFYI
jgi:hypothetical protein